MVRVWLTEEGTERLGLPEDENVLQLRAITDMSYKENYIVMEDMNGYLYILLPEEVRRIDPR